MLLFRGKGGDGQSTCHALEMDNALLKVALQSIYCTSHVTSSYEIEKNILNPLSL